MTDQASAGAPTTPGFDLSAFETNARDARLPLELPNGEPMTGTDGQPVVLDICSVDDERYLRVQRRVIDARIQAMKTKRNRNRTAAEMDQEQSALVAGGISGWTPNLAWDGRSFPYSPENAVKLVDRLRFVREQVDAAINDRERFFAKPSTS